MQVNTDLWTAGYRDEKPAAMQRRMLEAVDSKVRKLVRTAIGPVRIGTLQIGGHRPLQEQEIKQLQGLAVTARGVKRKL